MPRFDSDLCPHVLPMERSIGAPWGVLMPSRAHPAHGPASHFDTTDNVTRWDPYSGGDNLRMFPSDSPAPLPCRPAIGDPYVTPSRFWNISGPSGLDQGEWPIVVKGPSGGRYYQFGFQTPGQAPWGGMGHLGVKLPTPSVPPSMPFLGAGL